MGKLIWILFFAFCLISVHAKDEKEDRDDSEEAEDEEAASGDTEGTEEDSANEDDDVKEFSCNLKYQRIGCYADKGKKEKPLSTFMESDDIMTEDMDKKSRLPEAKTFNTELPKFACKCANDAINGGNAIFGLQNLAECWTGPDDSQYDKDGASEDCVTYDFAKCEGNSILCAGKKHANFMYFVDSAEHTKTQEELTQELDEAIKAENAAKAKKAKKSKKKSKKSKKA